MGYYDDTEIGRRNKVSIKKRNIKEFKIKTVIRLFQFVIFLLVLFFGTLMFDHPNNAYLAVLGVGSMFVGPVIILVTELVYKDII